MASALRQLLAVGIAVVMVAALPVSATASPEDPRLNCAFTAVLEFAPGVTDNQREVRVMVANGEMSGCTGNEGIRGGTVTGSGSATVDCRRGQASVPANVAWDNGKTSALRLDRLDVGGRTAAGTVTGGEFTNDSVTFRVTSVTPSGRCSSPRGVTSIDVRGGMSIR
ncbi:hypothetical protein GCM10012275_52320 [Longimycelium tulufanense]|uniref:Uncharacterized protein n=1 Tax=Longimycelium tulufanense TaxID=907463 RepID=A0A8J3FWX6_9PSEU|nr:hypothetical protein [Longimycelium tulufanense]GGM75170.1 hypothetical protein GCM10012275_52320 [Longimycelium tulufanense]